MEETAQWACVLPSPGALNGYFWEMLFRNETCETSPMSGQRCDLCLPNTLRNWEKPCLVQLQALAQISNLKLRHQKEPWFWDLVVAVCLWRGGSRAQVDPRGLLPGGGWWGRAGTGPAPPTWPGAGPISQHRIYEVHLKGCQGWDTLGCGCCMVPGALCSQGFCQGQAETLRLSLWLKLRTCGTPEAITSVMTSQLWWFWDVGNRDTSIGLRRQSSERGLCSLCRLETPPCVRANCLAACVGGMG